MDPRTLLRNNNRQIRVQLEELQAKNERKVTVELCSFFANIVTIKQSMDGAAKVGELAKERERSEEAETLRASRALEQLKMKSCMLEW